uniref:Heat shock protein 70 n=1 Tax=Timema bartmani TaxID=61472 RepID=A0A7R9I4A2_9NEOP|nr:unnamed protein product [Timema bartmani]
MAVAFGVHLGNSSACLALFRDGKIDVIANDSGDRVTPAVVSFHENEKVVGLAAKAGLARNLASTVTHNKQLLNSSLSEEEYSNVVEKHLCKIIKDKDSLTKYEVKRGEKLCYFSPEEIAVCIYKKMYSIANSSARSESELRAVLCVPLYFNQTSRQTVMRSAEEAGFDVLQVVSEPSAAVLAYGIGLQDEEELFCLVYRLGEFRQKWKLDPQESRRSMAKLMAAAETCKHKMVSDLFPEATMFSSINPDEVIAVGAAKQASFLSCSFDPDCEHLSMELPAVSKPIFIKLSGQSELKYVIPELSPVPVKRIHTYPVDSGYSEITVELYEKERIDSDTSKLLGKATLTELNGATQISVEVNINNIGGLHMTLTEPKSQIKASLKLDAPRQLALMRSYSSRTRPSCSFSMRSHIIPTCWKVKSGFSFVPYEDAMLQLGGDPGESIGTSEDPES